VTSPTSSTPAAADLQGHVVVTGGASGLGAAVARAVAGRGGTVTVLDRQPSADGFATEIVDLTDTGAAQDAVRRAADARDGLWAVVAAAGIDFPGRLDEVAADRWEQVIAVNLLGTAAVVRAALPYLRAADGRIVTVASTLGHRGTSDATAYCASKFGIVGFTRALTAELRGEVGVTLLTPGGMRTRFFDGRDEQYRPPDGLQLSPPEEVAEAVLFALTAPSTSGVRELVVTPPDESSWP
jgi:NAD(P)-dependent dehydrogenase (short-subunit alcohol dehydrogenase family)